MVSTVVIVDDSVMVRSALKKMINSDPEFDVIGTAADPFEARKLILDKEPDVLTLDVEMPRLDGLTFLERLMEHHPLPVVMVSSLTDSTTRKGMKALNTGAIEVVGKPSGDTKDSIKTMKDELLPKLRAAVRADVNPGQNTGRSETPKSKDHVDVETSGNVELIVIGSSTGGTNVLLDIFRELPTGLPPIMITQHMPPVFTEQFANHLDEESSINVFEAKEEGYVGQSEAVVAKGDKHLVVDGRPRRDRIHYSTNEEEEVAFQRPAVDPLFESAAQNVGRNVVALVLTGMGKDGRDGSRALAEKGATILTQDEDSCSVYGMPKQVLENVPKAEEIERSKIVPTLTQLSQ